METPFTRVAFPDRSKGARDRDPDHANLPVDPEFVQSRLPATSIQAQTDYFGAHMYEMIDMLGGLGSPRVQVDVDLGLIRSFLFSSPSRGSGSPVTQEPRTPFAALSTNTPPPTNGAASLRHGRLLGSLLELGKKLGIGIEDKSFKKVMGSIREALSVEWERESYPAYADFALLPFFALFFPSVRFFLDRFVFETAGRRLIFGKSYQRMDLETDEGKKRIRKFKESAWKCIYYLSAELLALSVTYDEPWFSNTMNFWVGPGNQAWPDQKIKFKLKGLYMYAAGFYAYSIFALIYWETRRSDFGVSMSHHLATLILIVLSYILRFARVGSVVLALHDASDVFLEVGKMSKYGGAEKVASFSFVLFVLSWIILRLIYYPFWILWSTSYEVILTLDKEKHRVDGPLYYYIFNSLLKFKREGKSVMMLDLILKVKMIMKIEQRQKIYGDIATTRL
ncbi:hypothetical protein NL676_037740 [Syzygium grande]|nr:hypothetical protein NL676_037740 [Syzygium grande]